MRRSSNIGLGIGIRILNTSSKPFVSDVTYESVSVRFQGEEVRMQGEKVYFGGIPK